MMPIKKTNLLFLLQVLFFNIILLSSVWILQQKNVKKELLNDTFKVPMAIQESNFTSKRLLTLNHINEIFPCFYGKHKFSDSVHLELKRDTAIYKDFVDLYYSKDSSDHIPTDGLQLFSDYKSNIHPKYWYQDSIFYYPVYIVNETKSAKLLHGKDSYLFAIQEAKDSNGVWHPIEMRGMDFCGHGRWALKIHPGEFAVFTMPKYDGTYETDLRVRLKNGDATLISKPFKGKINYNQFILKDSFWKNYGKKYPFKLKEFNFYGAEPLEFKDSY